MLILLLDFSLFLLALLTLQFPLAFARRYTLLPLANAGFIAYAIGYLYPFFGITASYLGGLFVSLALTAISFAISDTANDLQNMSISLVAVLAAAPLLMAIDPVGGSFGINTRPLMLMTGNGAPLVCAVAAIGFGIAYILCLLSPLYAAWTVACAGQAGHRLLPAKASTLFVALHGWVSMGSYLIAVVALHYGRMTANELGFGFLFTLLAASIFVNSAASVQTYSSTLRARIAPALCCIAGAAIVTGLTELLRQLPSGSANVGELRQASFWFLTVLTVLAVSHMPRRSA